MIMNTIVKGGGSPVPETHMLLFSVNDVLNNNELIVKLNDSYQFHPLVRSFSNSGIGEIAIPCFGVTSIEFVDSDYWQAETVVKIKPINAPDSQYWKPSLRVKYDITEDCKVYIVLGTCLLAGTLITMADGSYKPIEEVAVGDLIKGYYGTEKVTRSHKDYPQTTDKWDEWIFEDNIVIKTAFRHRFYNVGKKKMVYLDEWNIGEIGLTEDGKCVKLLDHKEHNEVKTHYTIFTENNTYYADKLLSGNRYSKVIN